MPYPTGGGGNGGPNRHARRKKKAEQRALWKRSRRRYRQLEHDAQYTIWGAMELDALKRRLRA